MNSVAGFLQEFGLTAPNGSGIGRAVYRVGCMPWLLKDDGYEPLDTLNALWDKA